MRCGGTCGPPPVATYCEIIRRSRYHDCERSTNRSRARSDIVSGARPGGTPRHFWVPLYAMSTPQSSIATGMPPSDVTQSTSSSASPLRSRNGAMSLRTPVDVSACTTAITFGFGCAAASASGSIGRPHSASTRTTSAPQRAATSVIRWPKTPFTPTTTTSPGFTTLTNDASMPADPVPLIGSVNALAVRNTVRSRSHVSSSTVRNSGSRWPSIGLRQRLDDLGVRVARARPHEDAIGHGHGGMLPMAADRG